MIPMKETATTNRSTEAADRGSLSGQKETAEPRRESEARYRKLAERHRETLDYLARH